MANAPLTQRSLHVLRDEPFRSYAAAVTLVASTLLIECHAASYFWDADGSTSSSTGGTGNWDSTSELWHLDSLTGPLLPWPADSADLTAHLLGTAGTLTLTTHIGVSNILSAPTSGTATTLAGTAGSLTLLGPSIPTIDVAPGKTLTITTQLSSTAGFRKSGTGTLILDNASNDITGGVLLAGGTLQIGSTLNNAAPLALRSTSIDLAAGTTLTASGSGTQLRIGNLTGTGTADVNRTLHLQSLGPANPLSPGAAVTHFGAGSVFSGMIKTTGLVLSGTGTGIVQLPGGVNVSMQTLNGHSSGITGTLTINSGAGLTLTGRESPLFPLDTSNIGSTEVSSVNLRGGALVLDNSTGNSTGGRVKLTTPVTYSSGSLVLVGSTVETSQAVGKNTFHSGANTISVIHKGASSGTILTISSGDRLTSSRSTIDFRSEGGTLGLTGGNPRIVFGDSAATLMGPWTTVNGSNYAQHTSNGIAVAAPTSLVSPVTSTGNATRYYQIAGNAEKGDTLFSALGLRLNPTAAGQSFNLTGSGDVQTAGLLLTGSHDYMLFATGSGGLTSIAPRYIGVAEPNTSLTIGASFKSPGFDIVKFGQGFLNLTGNNTGTLSSGHTAFVLNSGTLRATLGNTNASLPTLGTTSVVFRGGVLEIANGSGSDTSADFQFSLGTGAGKVNWATSDSDRGDGGFSAVNSNATINIGGAASPATLTWNDTYFVRSGNVLTFGSTKADRRVTLLNNLDLDSAAESGSYLVREIRVLDNLDSSITTDAARLSGIISGEPTTDLMKTGPGVLQLTGNNTFTGNTIVQSGTLQLGASDGAGGGAAGALGGTGKILVNANLQPAGEGGSLIATNRGTLLLDGDPLVTDRINDNSQLVLAGGIFNTNGRSETLGALTLLHIDSILNLGITAAGLNSSIVRFADSSANTWTGTLHIWGWSGNTEGGELDQLFFGNTASGLRPDQLASISFYSDNGLTFLGNAGIQTNGKIVPVPEPSPIIHTVALLGILAWNHRHRRPRAAGQGC